MYKRQVKNALVGGGFGGKEDMTVQHLAALLTYVTKKPVKVKLTRAESLLIHPKRHPFYMDMTMGCDEEGNIMGVKAVSYTHLGMSVMAAAIWWNWSRPSGRKTGESFRCWRQEINSNIMTCLLYTSRCV